MENIPEDNPFLTQFIKHHEYTIYEKMINLCDLMCKEEVMTIEKVNYRIVRRGAYANTPYHIQETYRLKQYFDEQLGFSVYHYISKYKRTFVREGGSKWDER